MRHPEWTARRKLFVSLTVLGLVLVVAAIAQFTTSDQRENPYAPATTSPAQGPRAVFGGDPKSLPNPTDAVAPRPSPTATSEPGTSTRSRTESVVEGSDASSIQSFLNRWRDTVAKGDVDGQAELYAPTVNRFFRQQNVSNAAVRKVKAQMMSLYPTVNKYEISDVKIESSNASEAVVSFRKEWDMAGTKPFAGAERQRLKLRRIGGDWKIVSEEELKVYWTKRR